MGYSPHILWKSSRLSERWLHDNLHHNQRIERKSVGYWWLESAMKNLCHLINKWYCQYSFTHFTQKFWTAVQWNKYPCSVAGWIFIPLRRPPICLSYPSNICGAFQPEAFRLSTSISACYSNRSCSSARSLFSAAILCNPCFFCRGCKTARSSFV